MAQLAAKARPYVVTVPVSVACLYQAPGTGGGKSDEMCSDRHNVTLDPQ